YGGVDLPPEVLQGSYVRFVLSRPFWIVPASTAALSPLLALGAWGLAREAWRALRRREPLSGPAGARERAALALASLALAFVLATVPWPSRESRYLLPAYAPLAAGVALAWEAALAWTARQRSPRALRALATALVLSALAWSAAHAVALGPSGLLELTP